MNEKEYPLTAAQNVVANLADFVHTLELLSLIAVVDFKSEIDEELMKKAIVESVKRLPYCNVRFRRREDGTVVQYLCGNEPEPIETVDLSQEEEANLEEVFRQWNRDAFPESFEEIQLYKFKILHYQDGHQGLFFCFQHFIMDGYAGIYTLHYVSKVYTSLLCGTELPSPGPEPWPLIDNDLAFHASPRYQKGFQKLCSYFDTEPCFSSINGAGAPEFVEGKRYGKKQDFSQFGGGMISYPLQPAFGEMIEKEAKRLNIAPLNFFLLALRSYQGRVSNTDDVTIASLVCCRSTLFEKHCGMNMADSQLVRSVIPDDCSFQDAVLMLSDIQNEELRYAKVVDSEVISAVNEKYGVPENGTYFSSWLTYFPPVTHGEGLIDLSVKFVTNGWAAIPLYMLIIPDSNHGTMSATYSYALGYTPRENVERFHAFMLKFLEKGIAQPDKAIGTLVDESI